MRLFIPNRIIDYPGLKARLFKRTAMLSGALVVGFGIWDVALGLYCLGGALIGYAYLMSLSMSVEAPRQGRMTGSSIGRMALAGFLLAALGGGRPLETGVVICGFLSYKGVLLLEALGYCVGLRRSRGD